MPETKFTLPRSALSENKMERRQVLDEYFPSGLIPFEQRMGNQWEVTTFVPQDPAYYVDPNIEKNLNQWQHLVSIESIGNYRSIYKNVMISFYDSWTLYYWSLLLHFLNSNGLIPDHLSLLHLDDHKDLSSPLLSLEKKSYYCLFSREEVKVLDPVSIQKAIILKSIGIGSYIVPLVNFIPSLDILHLRYAQNESKQTGLELTTPLDSLLAVEKHRPLLMKINEPIKNLSYSTSPSLSYFSEKLEKASILLLHIDCDVFSNRYNLDSNWNPRTVSIDLNLRQIKIKIHKLMEQLSQLSSSVYMNIALSPGFFPSDYWKEVCNYLILRGEKAGFIKNDSFSKYLANQYPEELCYEITSNKS